MNKIFKHPVIIIIILTIVPSALLILILSSNPILSFYAFVTGPFSNVYSFGNMLNNAAPLMLTSLGAFIALKSNSFNLGGEGQVYLGATITGILSIYLNNTIGVFTLPFIIIVALFTSGILTWISAWLEIKYRVNSLISTYLLSMTIIHICNYFVTGPFLMEGSNILTTSKINKSYYLPKILEPSALSAGFLIALILVIIISLYLKNTLWGYEFTISGKNRVFAESMGIKSLNYRVAGLTISGVLHGAAGVILVLGNHHSVIVGINNNLGWNGLSSALLAGSRPIMVIISSLFYSFLDAGSSYATITSDVTIELSQIIKSVLFFVISSRLIKDKFIKRGIE
ncbi:ABC transporter permease [Thiospirochaeta perfilievii]|uniref:ABC transporter permease n=1 Tax=Thiospirochaeta perfilievii TaxID=252967 RepID=A0A5C1QBX9_9SPIO|nr:ABC transporter permease [Thiospirochaeta perfilievii]QEN05027.1 ABC transporter permease [Thiospirochaeta perfilievii]